MVGGAGGASGCLLVESIPGTSRPAIPEQQLVRSPGASGADGTQLERVSVHRGVVGPQKKPIVRRGLDVDATYAWRGCGVIRTTRHTATAGGLEPHGT